MTSKMIKLLFLGLILFIQVFQILFSSIFTYTLFGEEGLIWIGKNEMLFGSIVYFGGVISFPIAAYIAFNSTDYFQERNISLMKALLVSTLLGLLVLIRFFFPFGVLLVALPFVIIVLYLAYRVFQTSLSTNTK